MLNRLRATVSACLLAALMLSACQAPAAGEPPPAAGPTALSTPTAAHSLPVFSHVFIIVLENKDETSIVNNPQAPYINELAEQYGRADQFYGIRHPSLPNYLALTGGDTFSITSDCTDCFIASDNIVSQLQAAGRSWKAYMESLPADPCHLGDVDPLYKQKHNPFIYYDNVRTQPAACANIVPLSQLQTDLQANAVPDYAWISPNMCDNMHDCPISTGDAWVQTWVSAILASPAWKDNGVLFITFDEGKGSQSCCTYASGGRIDTLVISPLTPPGFVSETPYDHYSILRTIEEAWGLPLLGQAQCDCSAPMLDFFPSQ